MPPLPPASENFTNSDLQVRLSKLAGRAGKTLFMGSEGEGKSATIAYTLMLGHPV
jgi:hypothetical protein